MQSKTIEVKKRKNTDNKEQKRQNEGKPKAQKRQRAEKSITASNS